MAPKKKQSTISRVLTKVKDARVKRSSSKRKDAAAKAAVSKFSKNPFDGVSGELLNQIYDNVINPDDSSARTFVRMDYTRVFEGIPDPGTTPPAMRSESFERRTTSRIHPMLEAVPILKDALVSKFFFDNRYFWRIALPDPELRVFKQYLDSFEGYLAYVGFLNLDVGLPIEAGAMIATAANTGRVKIKLDQGKLTVMVSPSLRNNNPNGLSISALVREISKPWVELLKAKIKESQDYIEKEADQTKDDWMGVQEDAGTYTAAWV